MACIPVVDPTCNPIADFVADSVAKMLEAFGVSMGDAAAWAIKTLVTGWLMVPSPIMDNQDVVTNLRKYTYWAVAAIAVFSLLVAATRMALERSGKAATDAVTGMVKLMLVTALVVPVTITLTEVGDGYSTWIINKSANGQLGERVLAFVPDDTRLKGIAVIAAIVVSFMCLVVSMVQMLISIAVGGLKIILCGIAPVPAAANIAGGGKTTLARYLSWLGAVLLYKPAAATIYAAGFWMVGAGTSFETVLTGVVIIAMALVALPALLRLFAPIASQAVGGSGGAAAGAGIAGAGSIATGAVRLAAARGSSGGGSGGGPSAPGGSQGAPPQRSTPAIGPGGGQGGGAGGGGARPPSGPGPVGTGAGAGAGATGAGSAAGGGAAAGGAAGGGAAAGGAAGGGAAAGGAAAGGAAAAAGPVGAAVAAGTVAAKAGPAVVRKVGGLASGAAEGGEQQ